MGWECPFCHAHKACHCDCDKRLVSKYEELKNAYDELEYSFTWRKVEEELPEFDVSVLVFNGDYSVCYRYDHENNPRGLYFAERKYYDSIIWYRTEDEVIQYHVTHWMPFPEVPNE